LLITVTFYSYVNLVFAFPGEFWGIQNSRQKKNCLSYSAWPNYRYEFFFNYNGVALGHGLDDRGSRVRFPAGLVIFLFTTSPRTSLGPTHPPIQWVSGALSQEVKRPESEADHLSPSSAEVKNAWSYT